MKIWDRVVSAVLILAVVGTIGALVYVVANPKGGERFTEFYLLGLSGKATDYPEGLRVGEGRDVTVGIINQECEPLTYRVEVVIDGVKNGEVGPVTLEHGGKWEETASFTPNRVGGNQKVEFLLYRQGQNAVNKKLHLWIDVIKGEEFEP